MANTKFEMILEMSFLKISNKDVLFGKKILTWRTYTTNKALLFDKAFNEFLAEYSNYSNVFSVENTVKLPKNSEINKHGIKLEESKQLPFGLIYSLGLVELETLKTYIKTNLANGFI